MSFSTEQPPNWMEEAQKSRLTRVVDSFEERQRCLERTHEALGELVAATLATLVNELENLENDDER